MKLALIILLMGTVLNEGATGQGPGKPRGRGESAAIPHDLYFSKGGMGVINQDLYIVVNSRNNELSLKNDARWTGKSAGTREVVIVYQGRVLSGPEVPATFDLRDSVVVSFQGNIVRFFVFATNKGGFYRRDAPQR